MSVLSIGSIISGAFRIGMKNLGTILGSGILWILTIWIPYLNVGTTIAMFELTVRLSRGESFSPGEIFDKKYRENMGEYFLAYGLSFAGILIALCFMILPGIILAVAWSQAFLLMQDRGLSPMEAIRKSNKITYGDKWNMILGLAILQVIFFGLLAILSSMERSSGNGVIALLGLVVIFLSVFVSVGANAYIYGELVTKLNKGGADQSPAMPDSDVQLMPAM